MTNRIFWPIFSLLVFLSMSMTFIAANDHWKESFRNLLLKENRSILAKATGDFFGKGKSFVVLKVKARDTLSIEVFELSEGLERPQFRNRVILPEKRDGHFTYRDNATNMMLLDLNSDGMAEIVTAAFDENLVPRVHVYRFDPEKDLFEELGPETLKL